MQPFSISCLTCGTKLKVSDESLIGEILMCAKCHSMVLVEQSSDEPAETKAAAATGAAAIVALDSPPDLEAPPIDVPEPPADPPVQEVVAEPAVAESALQAPVAREAAAASEPLAPSVEQPPVPTIPAAPALESQRWIMMGAAGAVGVMFVVSIWLFMKSQSTASLPADTTDSKPEVETAGPNPESAKPDPEQQPVDPPAQPAPTQDKGDSDPIPAKDDSPIQPDPKTVNQDPKPDSDAVADDVPADNALVVPEEDVPDGDTVTMPPEVDADQTREEPIDYPIPGPNPDIASRLAMRIEAIEIAGQANQGEVLRNATTLLSQMTSVPIRVDSVALKRLGINDEIPVRAIMQNTTATEVLDAMLRNWGLAAVPTGNRVVVTLPSASESPLSEGYAFPFNDLAKDADELRQIADLIQQMVEPPSWKREDGPTVSVKADRSLVIRQTRLARREILLLSEKLRVARGLKPRSTIYRNNPESLPMKSLSRRMAPRFAEPIDAPAVQQIKLADFALGLQHRTGIEFSVDEFALIRAGLSPDMVIDCDAQQKTLVEYLLAVFKPLGLAVRVISPDAIQITTPRELARTPDVEFYMVGNMAIGYRTPDELIARIKSEVDPKYWQSAGKNAAFYYDEPSKCLIVRASQPVQQLLEYTFRTWQGE
jgi:hypothetical protein